MGKDAPRLRVVLGCGHSQDRRDRVCARRRGRRDRLHPDEQPDADQVTALIRDCGRKAVALPADLRDERAARQVVRDAVAQLGGLDILVCNAGRQQAAKSILDVTAEEFDATMKTNVYAPFWMIQEALPHLAPGACIIGTTSEQAYDPSPELYAYAQTKAATMNYVKSLAKMLGEKGIRVNGVAPGAVYGSSGGQGQP